MKPTLVFILSLITMTSIFSDTSKEEAFWNWFTSNEIRIFEFEKNQEKIFDELSDELAKFREGIVFEFSKEKDGKREFILSADGLKELFPSIQALHQKAPKFERWEVIAFRPRMEDYTRCTLEYGGIVTDPKKLWIYYRVQDGNFDLIVYHPNYDEEQRNSFVSRSYILLDMAIGEYDVVTGVRYIDHQRLPEDPKNEGLLPFGKLREVFDEYKNNKG